MEPKIRRMTKEEIFAKLDKVFESNRAKGISDVTTMEQINAEINLAEFLEPELDQPE